MRQHRTADGDRLDTICKRLYDAQSGVVEAVLEANPGLAARGPVLPAGLLVALPDLPRPAEAKRPTRLWD